MGATHHLDRVAAAAHNDDAVDATIIGGKLAYQAGQFSEEFGKSERYGSFSLTMEQAAEVAGISPDLAYDLAASTKRLEKASFERFVVLPLAALSELAAHEQQLLAGMTPHVTVEEPQVRKLLPGVARHFADEAGLAKQTVPYLRPTDGE